NRAAWGSPGHHARATSSTTPSPPWWEQPRRDCTSSCCAPASSPQMPRPRRLLRCLQLPHRLLLRLLLLRLLLLCLLLPRLLLQRLPSTALLPTMRHGLASMLLEPPWSPRAKTPPHGPLRRPFRR